MFESNWDLTEEYILGLLVKWEKLMHKTISEQEELRVLQEVAVIHLLDTAVIHKTVCWTLYCSDPSWLHCSDYSDPSWLS